MMKFFALLFFVSTAHAYVPTVESLFRHGSNPEVSADGVSITLNVKRINPGEKSEAPSGDASLLTSEREEDFYKIYFSQNEKTETLKIAQTRYNSAQFSENSLEHKVYFSNFTGHTIKADIEHMEKGLFYALLQSLVLNNGRHVVNYLKAMGVPVRLNDEILNREKIEFLADYKRYLVTISKDRNARKTEVNPMRPEDPAARERADEIMGQPMYVDTDQVKLGRDSGNIAWIVNAGNFEAVFSYKLRDLYKIKFKSPAGDYEMLFKDYWLANGTHSLPRFILIKSLNGQSYQVEITNLRHYVEKPDDFIKRLSAWDQILKGKESTELRPPFLL